MNCLKMAGKRQYFFVNINSESNKRPKIEEIRLDNVFITYVKYVTLKKVLVTYFSLTVFKKAYNELVNRKR